MKSIYNYEHINVCPNEMFSCHMQNGGLCIQIEKHYTNESVQYLSASMSHFGNEGPKASIPLFTIEQINAMICLLEKAKESVTSEHSHMVEKPKFIE